jgi:hypothetical protein
MPLRTFCRISFELAAVIWSSPGVNHPEVFGNEITSSWLDFGMSSEGISHSDGIDDKSSALFAAAIAFHGAGDDTVTVILSMCNWVEFN